MMFVVSHTYSNYLGRYSMVAQVSEVTMPDWMSVPVAFGVVDSNEHFSMLGCSTQMLQRIRLNHSRPHIGNMSRRNGGSMVREFGRLREPHSHH